MRAPAHNPLCGPCPLTRTFILAMTPGPDTDLRPPYSTTRPYHELASTLSGKFYSRKGQCVHSVPAACPVVLLVLQGHSIDAGLSRGLQG